MEFIPSDLSGVILVKPDVHADPRGFFLESYARERFVKGGISPVFISVQYASAPYYRMGQ